MRSSRTGRGRERAPDPARRAAKGPAAAVNAQDDLTAVYLARSDPEATAACELAVALSPAAFVEPELLRAVRRTVFPRFTVEAEADLWFSPLVRDRTASGLSFTPRAVELLHERLRAWLRDERRALAEQAARIILGRDASALRLTAERVTWWSLSSQDERIAPELASVRAAVENGHAGTTRWAVRSLAALPRETRGDLDVWRLAASASQAAEAAIDLGDPESAVFDALGFADARTVDVPVRRVAGRLEFGSFPAARAFAIRMPDVRPWRIEVQSQGERQTVSLLPGAAATADVSADEVLLRGLGGATHRVPPTVGSVVERIADAPPGLASDLLDFRGLIDDKTTGFVGREWLFAALDAALAELPSGYLVVEGEPGIGKTALIAQLAKSRGWVHHFVSATAPRPYFPNLCAQLVLRYGLAHDRIPAADAETLGALLEEAVEAAGDEPVVILLDALDEAGGDLRLPTQLPRGAFVIATWPEPATDLLGAPLQVIALRADDPLNLEDLQAYVRAQGADPQPIVSRSYGNFALAKELRQESAPRAAPFVLLDRAVLRDAVRELAAPDGPRVLIVNGPPGSGKSFSERYIRHVTTELSHEVETFRYSPGTPPIDPGDLAGELSDSLGPSAEMPIAGQTTTAAYIGQLRRLLVEAAMSARRDIWWILDAFGGPEVPEGVQDLITAVAAQMSTRRPSTVRLVLLDFPVTPSLGEAEQEILEAPEGVGRIEVAEFFYALVQSGEFDRDAVDGAVAAVLDGLPEGRSRLAELALRVAELASSSSDPR
jgi:hypothetical protein